MFQQNKIISLPTYPNFFGMKQEPHIYFILALSTLKIGKVWTPKKNAVTRAGVYKGLCPNSLPLTVNSHHVLFVKSLPKFSKGHYSRKIR